MLHVIDHDEDEFAHLILSDPVRPHIPVQHRLGSNGRVLVLQNHAHEPQSVICVAFSDHVVTDESDLFSYEADCATVCMLYSIWSLCKGGGQAMLPELKHWVRHNHAHIQRMVTLSPQTEMARRFHLKNGAWELQVNSTTVNFEYDLR
jgi:hypothetical protein